MHNMVTFLFRKHLSLLEISWKCSQISFISCFYTINVNNISLRQLTYSKNVTTNSDANMTVDELRKKWISTFELHSIPEPEASIRYIIEHALGISQASKYLLMQNEQVTEAQVEKISELCECRLARMPVQYIIKEWDFRDLQLKMYPPVFIPRPETEQLVDLVLEKSPRHGIILEVGCGSGAIALSLLKALPGCQVVALDQSKMACQLTLRNARLNHLTDNLQVVHSKLLDNGTLSTVVPVDHNGVDVLVSNPPYVPYKQLANLEPEIKLYEDLRALEAGGDGLRVIKALLLFAQKILKPGAPIFLEVDTSHPPLIKEWLLNHSEIRIKFVRSVQDYCDRERFVELKKF